MGAGERCTWTQHRDERKEGIDDTNDVEAGGPPGGMNESWLASSIVEGGGLPSPALRTHEGNRDHFFANRHHKKISEKLHPLHIRQ